MSELVGVKGLALEVGVTPQEMAAFVRVALHVGIIPRPARETTTTEARLWDKTELMEWFGRSRHELEQLQKPAELSENK